MEKGIMLKRLFAVGLLVLVLSSVGTGTASAATCTEAERVQGICVDNDGDKVTIIGEEDNDGDGGGGGSDDDGDSDGLDRDGYTVTGPFTITDIAHFRPTPGTNHMEPNGWMIVGLPTNFYAHASQHVVSGTLLDRPAWVRFTPSLYRWTYGDGAAKTVASPGGTWKQLGKKEFDETPASHRYQNPGRYIINLTIYFNAEWRWADMTGWVPVSGQLALPANPLEAVAGSAKTVLVERDCVVNPSGPGC